MDSETRDREEAVMIDLTPQQIQSLDLEEKPIRLRDPRTASTYVLVPSDLYELIKALIDEDGSFVEDMYAQTMELMRRDGWDDPEMDIYNNLDPRRKT
jgi:hypothetical protein